jgi:hypothetical protein
MFIDINFSWNKISYNKSKIFGEKYKFYFVLFHF